MKKKLALLISVVVLAALAVGGATYALFTDDAINKNNTFVAGTVDIDSYRDGFDTIPGPMFYTTPEEGKTPTDPPYDGLKPTGIWAPGDTHIRSLVVYNKGSLDVVLNKIAANKISDPENINTQMKVAVYKVLPKFLPNGTPFVALPGDDSMPYDQVEQTSLALANWGIMLANRFIDVENLAQLAIEHQVNVNPHLVWSGTLDQLLNGYVDLDPEIAMKATGSPFVDRGCLLAFVVQLDKEAGNDYQGADAKFDFSVLAEQARNN